MQILSGWSYHALQLFPTNQRQLISSPYFSFQYLKVEFTKIAIYQVSSKTN